MPVNPVKLMRYMRAVRVLYEAYHAALLEAVHNIDPDGLYGVPEEWPDWFFDIFLAEEDTILKALEPLSKYFEKSLNCLILFDRDEDTVTVTLLPKGFNGYVECRDGHVEVVEDAD